MRERRPGRPGPWGHEEDGTEIHLPTPKVLIVDDTPANLLAFEVALEPLGYEIVKAASGRDALRYLLTMDVSLVLMDVQMPDMNGIETVKLIKQSRRHRYIPILFITAVHRSMSFILEGYETGAVDYVLKPCQPSILRSKVTVLVELFRQKEIVKRQAALLRAREREAMERRCELRYQGVIEAMPICVWTTNGKGHFHYANDAWSRYAGLGGPRDVGRGLLEALHPDDRGHVTEVWRKALGRRLGVTVQARLRRSDGAYRWHIARAVPQRDEGRVTGWILTATDIDEQKRAEEAAHRARKEAEAANCEIMKDEFLATVSHELNTPLTAIVGWSSLLRTGTLDGPIAARGLATIARSAEAERRVVEDILDASRIATGRLLLHLAPIDPTAIIDEAIDALRPLARAKGITFECEMKSRGAVMMADPDRLWQVTWKLVFNAIKFTPSGGRVDVRFEHLGKRFLLTVSDTGEGIAQGRLPQVFEYFSQEDNSTKRKHGGLGLGLAIVRKLVELHGGSVSATSAGKGAGATFTVSLPSRKEPEGAEVPAEVPRVTNYERRILEGIRVLLALPDAEAKELVADVLQRRGATVFSVASAEEAVGFVAESAPDVVVSEMGMPGRDNAAFVERLRARDGHALPVIAVLEVGEADQAWEALCAGFRGYVAKPIHPAHLVAAIARIGRGRGETEGGATACKTIRG
ncbi:response regulator [Polyangium mundeleinium]|uniref:histidine kinase n=1 Tax=Polyangium mundeleinium TaxID=2995306 RepID=A0ABT5EXP2_9BACT|nr:response regulator [Polyangium mundeleinium]MDC0746047.1 response regulator [Polyangium mundeleinium]